MIILILVYSRLRMNPIFGDMIQTKENPSRPILCIHNWNNAVAIKAK